MNLSAPIDDFRLAYDRHGEGPPVVLLHGWPGDRSDYREVVPLLAGSADVIVPDFRGFGASDKHLVEPKANYSAGAQGRSIVGLMDELGVGRAVLAGYDVGSAVARTIAEREPARVAALVLSPPLPGAGDRYFGPDSTRETWYQRFHRLDLAVRLLDGRREAIRDYLRHFWDHWSGPGFRLPESDLDRLVDAYAPPGAYEASVGWYRAAEGPVPASLTGVAPAPGDRIACPASILWPEHDPLFPFAWSDRIVEFFARATIEHLAGAGHFTPLEAPEKFAGAIRHHLNDEAQL